MIGLGDLSPDGGLIHPEQIITGPHFEQLIDTLANGRLLLKYFDDPSWLASSSYVAL